MKQGKEIQVTYIVEFVGQNKVRGCFVSWPNHLFPYSSELNMWNEA